MADPWGDACRPDLLPKVDYTRLKGRNRARYPLRIFTEAECRAHLVEDHHGHYGKLLKIRDWGKGDDAELVRGHALSPRVEAVEAAWGAWSWSTSGFSTEHFSTVDEFDIRVLIGHGERSIITSARTYTYWPPRLIRISKLPLRTGKPKQKPAKMPANLWGEPLKLVTIARWTVQRAKRIEPPAATAELVIVAASPPRRIKPKRIYNDRPWMNRLRKVTARPPIMREDWHPGDDWRPDRHRHFGAWERDRYRSVHWTRKRPGRIAEICDLLGADRFVRPILGAEQRRKADGS